MESKGFDSSLVSNFISNEPLEYQDELKLFLLNTHYLTKDYIIQEARKLVDKFVKARDNSKSLGIFVDSGKIGSKHWLIKECSDLLPKYTLVKEKSKVIVDELLYLDDIVITGHQCLGILDSYSYLNNRKNTNLVILVVAIHESNELLKELSYIQKLYKSVEHNFTRVLSKFNVSPKFFEKYCMELQPLANVHMEYKIPDSFCVYSNIYEKCRHPPNRDFMLDVEKFFS